jgi:hypothetical protein
VVVSSISKLMLMVSNAPSTVQHGGVSLACSHVPHRGGFLHFQTDVDGVCLISEQFGFLICEQFAFRRFQNHFLEILLVDPARTRSP